MPTREPAPRTFEERVTADFAADLQSVEDRLVAEAGPPPDTKRLSEAEKDRLWALRDPSVDYETLAQQLTTGLPIEEVKALVIVQEFPEWEPIFGQPTESAETADQLARMAEFPYRWQMLADLEPPEMVKEADRMDARYQQAMGGEMTMPMEMAPQQPAAMQQTAPRAPPVGVGGAQEQVAAAPPGGFAGIGMGVSP